MLRRASLLLSTLLIFFLFLAPANANSNFLVGIGQALGIVPEASEIPDAGTDTIDLGECHLDSKEHCFLENGDGYNDCDGDLYSCRSCGVGMYVPYRPIDVYYPVIEDCRRCPSWTRNVINSAVWSEVFVKCTARCNKQGSYAIQDIYAGEIDPHYACHSYVDPDYRQCSVCPSGKYRIETPPPVTTWNAPDRAQFTPVSYTHLTLPTILRV